MRSNFPFIVSVTLPFGAAPGQQRLFFGPASGFPPALISYLQGNGWDPVGGIIAYGQSIGGGGVDDNYAFFVQGVAFPGEQPSGWLFGNFTTGLFETQVLMSGGIVYVSPFGENIQLSIGSGAGPGNVTLAHGKLSTDGGQIIVNSAGPGIDVQSGGSIGVESGGTVSVSSGGTSVINSGGLLHINGGQLTIDFPSTFSADPNGVIGQRALGRGLMLSAESNSNSGAIGAETIYQGLTSTLFKNGRAYRAYVAVSLASSIANNSILWRLREGSVTGTILRLVETFLTVAGGAAYELNFSFIFCNSSGLDIATGLQLTLQAAAGTVTAIGAGAQGPFSIQIEDIGSTLNYSGYPSLT